MWASNGIAADITKPWLFGPITAAFGPVEAQGRGSLHPHILIWLVIAELNDLLSYLRQDPTTFKERLRLWMLELIADITVVQESSVTQFPQSMQPGLDTASGAQIPPLPFGPNERRNYHADGAAETATRAELGLEVHENDDAAGDEETKQLYYYDPKDAEEDMWQPAVRPALPLRSDARDELTEEEYKRRYDEANTSLWTKKISDWASGRFPQYRVGERTRVESLSGDSSSTEEPHAKLLREAVPSEDFLNHITHDARDLVIGCAIHL